MACTTSCARRRRRRRRAARRCATGAPRRLPRTARGMSAGCSAAPAIRRWWTARRRGAGWSARRGWPTIRSRRAPGARRDVREGACRRRARPARRPSPPGSSDQGSRDYPDGLGGGGPVSHYVQGVQFGTVGARKGDKAFEITTFREDVYPEDERKPRVTFGKDIKTDLSRRDFTINAMAIRLPEGELLDPFGGVKDLAAKRLDTPLDPELAFSDDPLRMLRAARFAAQLDVVPSPRVVEAITAMRD